MTISLASEQRAGSETAAFQGARGDLYAALSRGFFFPGDQLHSQILDGGWLDILSATTERLSYAFGAVLSRSWAVPSGYETFESEYIRLFEIGNRAGPPCPLHTGHYSRDRLKTLEGLIRFYNFFGLRIAPGLMPDHLSVQLEFMHYLATRQLAARTNEEGDSAWNAQRDFVQRHLTAWWPVFAERVKSERPLPFYRSLVALTGRFLEQEREYLSGAPARRGGS